MSKTKERESEYMMIQIKTKGHEMSEEDEGYRELK